MAKNTLIAHSHELSHLSDDELLDLRFKDLKLSIERSPLQNYVEQLYKELDDKGLRFKPKIFLGDEWFSPEGMNAIAIPFYLSHDRLKKLEKRMMLDVEGDQPDYFMKLLRHEAGHCFDHCYQFSQTKKWSKTFGSPEEDYDPDTYRPHPYSKSYVKHLDRWYAQAHPDEDFAETFAVWLNPHSQWKKQYAKWPVALRKLNYIDVIASLSTALPDLSEDGYLPSNVKNLTTTLKKHYAKRTKEYEHEYPDFYDSDLKKIFSGTDDITAEKFMKRYSKNIVETVAWATGEKKYTIDSFVKRLTNRAQQLNLKLSHSEVQTVMEVTSLLTSLVKNYLFTGKFKREA